MRPNTVPEVTTFQTKCISEVINNNAMNKDAIKINNMIITED